MSLTGAAYELLPVKDVDRGAMTGMAQLAHTVPKSTRLTIRWLTSLKSNETIWPLRRRLRQKRTKEACLHEHIVYCF